MVKKTVYYKNIGGGKNENYILECKWFKIINR